MRSRGAHNRKLSNFQWKRLNHGWRPYLIPSMRNFLLGEPAKIAAWSLKSSLELARWRKRKWSTSLPSYDSKGVSVMMILQIRESSGQSRDTLELWVKEISWCTGNPLTLEFYEWIQVVTEIELLKILGRKSGLKRVDLLFDPELNFWFKPTSGSA